MRENVKKQIRNAKKRRIRRRRFYAAVALCSILVAGIVSWKLILPGTAMSGETYCGKEEHTHSDACYEQVLVCGQEEGTGAHTHTDACYTDVRTDQLICGQEESEGHVHTDACYTNELTCGQEENAEHTHTDACYTKTLTCGQEEGAGAHTHTDACYATERKLTCGQEEGAGHTHTDACYKTELTCGKEEHKHTSECYSNPDAVETEDQWKAAFKNYKLTGEWGKDTAAVAKSQVGYKESTENYKVNEDESTDGYTRYADWAGDDIYGDWNTDFAAFCLNYAGVPADKFPVNADDLGAWITAMNNAGYYGDPDSTEPQPGDLIVLKKADQDNKQTIGIVSEVKTDKDGNVTKVKVIEGDCDDEVKENKYDADSSEIVGYGLVNEAYGDVAGSGEEEKEQEDTAFSEDGASETESENAELTDDTKTDSCEDIATITDVGEKGYADDNISKMSPDENGNLFKVQSFGEPALKTGSAFKATIFRAMAKSDGTQLDQYITDAKAYKIENGNWVPSEHFNNGDQVKVELSYTFPQGLMSTKNNVAVYQMDDGLRPLADMTGPVYDNDRNRVGTYSISTDGEIVITFLDDFVKEGKAITGTISFEGQLNSDNQYEDTDVNLGGDGNTITIDKVEPAEQTTQFSLQKTGTLEDEDGNINYTITVRTSTGTEGGVTITDQFRNESGSATYVQDSLQVTRILENGTRVPVNSDNYIVEWNTDSGSFEINGLANLDINESYEVTYQATPVLPSDLGNGYSYVKNSVKVEDERSQSWGESTVQISANMIYKSGSYNPDTGLITWIITLNPDAKASLDGWVLTDQLDGVSIPSNTEITISPAIITTNNEVINSFYLEDEQYTFPPGTGNNTYTLTYTTEPEKGQDEYENTATITGEDGKERTDTGKVTVSERQPDMYKQSKGETSVSEDVEGSLKNYNWISKITLPSKEWTSYTYTDTITNGTVNGQEAEGMYEHYALKNKVEDAIKGSLEYTYFDSGEKTDVTLKAEESWSEYINIEIICYDSTGQVVKDNDTHVKSFKVIITPKEDSIAAEYSKFVEFGYSTWASIKGTPSDTTVVFKNSADLDEVHRDATQEYTTPKDVPLLEKQALVFNSSGNLTAYDKEGNVAVDYNSQIETDEDGKEHAYLYYRIAIKVDHWNDDWANPSGSSYKVELTDTLPEGLTVDTENWGVGVGFNDDSNEPTTDEDFEPFSNVDNWKLNYEVFQKYFNKTVRMEVSNNSGDDETTNVKFIISGDGSNSNIKRIFIYYRAEITDPRITDDMTSTVILPYKNTVQWERGDDLLESSVTTVVTHEGERLNKNSTPIEEEGTGEYYGVEYTLVINPTGRDLNPYGDEVTLVDTMTAKDADGNDATNKVRLDLDNIVLYYYSGNPDDPIDLDSSGNPRVVSAESYRFYYDYDAKEIKLICPDQMAYVLKYQYLFDGSQIITESIAVNNSATLTGGYSDETEDNLKVYKSEATANNIGINLYKVDADNMNYRLSGAKFILYKCEGNTWSQVKELACDKDGTLHFDGKADSSGKDDDEYLHSNTLYKLEETKAPDGYKIDTNDTYYMVWLDSGSTIDIVLEEVSADVKLGFEQMSAENPDHIFIFSGGTGEGYITNTRSGLAIEKAWVDLEGNKVTPPADTNVEVEVTAQKQEMVLDGYSVTVNYELPSWVTAVEPKEYTVEKGSKFQIYNEIGWWSPDCEVSITTTSEETVLIPDEEDADIGHRYIWSTNIESDCTITISANWDMSNKLIMSYDKATIEIPNVIESYEIGTYVLNDGNDWRYSVPDDDLEAKLGEEYLNIDWVFTVTEVKGPSGYMVRYRNNGGIRTGTIYVVNVKPEQDDYELPETGGIGTKVYIAGGAILMMSSCLLGGYRMRRKRERRRR